MQHRIRRMVIFALVLCPLATLMADGSGAMLYFTGNVTVNGKEVTTGTAIFTGDRVETAEGSVATINQDGASTTVGPNSAIALQKTGIQLLRGTARVKTDNGVLAHAGQVTVSPKTKAAFYEVSRVGKTVQVSSREGALSVVDAGHTTSIGSGARTTVDAFPAASSSANAGGSQLSNATIFSDWGHDTAGVGGADRRESPASQIIGCLTFPQCVGGIH